MVFRIEYRVGLKCCAVVKNEDGGLDVGRGTKKDVSLLIVRLGMQSALARATRSEEKYV